MRKSLFARNSWKKGRICRTSYKTRENLLFYQSSHSEISFKHSIGWYFLTILRNLPEKKTVSVFSERWWQRRWCSLSGSSRVFQQICKNSASIFRFKSNTNTDRHAMRHKQPAPVAGMRLFRGYLCVWCVCVQICMCAASKSLNLIFDF